MASRSNRKWLSLGSLAGYVGCSQRTIRQYCKSGLIAEAFMTAGGRWRVRRPLSPKTKRFLLTKKNGCAWDPSDGNAIGDFESEDAEILTEAHLRGKLVEDLYGEAEESDLSETEINTLDRIAKEGRAAEMHKAVRAVRRRAGKTPLDQGKLDQIERDGFAARKRIWETQLLGWVKQHVLKYPGSCPTEPPPTVAEITQTMKISRSEFYRRGLSSKKIKGAYRIALNEFICDLADSIAVDSTHRANVKAKKPIFSQVQDDFSDAKVRL